MKTILSLVFLGSVALADGFICVNEDQALKIQVYHNTDANEGTRVAKVMVVSDLLVNNPNSTIATFHQGETLTNKGTRYTARVDSRYNDIRDGELIGGTKLKYLHSIVLDVQFSYSDPVADGVIVLGSVDLVKENGEVLSYKMDCERYLKN